MKLEINKDVLDIIREHHLKSSRQIEGILLKKGYLIPRHKVCVIRDEYHNEIKNAPYFAHTSEWVDMTPINHRETATYKDMFCSSFDSNEVVGKRVN
jgi:hypothetical protein